MSFLLLVFSVILLFVLFYLTSARSGFYTNIRVSLVLSLIVNAAIIFLYNEAFSAFNAISMRSATVFWLTENLILTAVLFYLNAIGRISIGGLSSLTRIFRFKGIGKTSTIIIIVSLLLYILPLLFLALYAPPNNFDSHSYHLNRMLFWINNGNLDHFPTQHIQHLYLNVFAEYLLLDNYLLTGSDQNTGLIQFGAFIGSLAAISLLAGKFGLKANAQILATVFLLTLPIGIFESTSTQVDYVACFFFISYVYFGYDLIEKKSSLSLLGLALCLAFGGSSKYTIFIFAIPFTLYFAIRILVKYRIAYALKVLLVAATVLLLTFSAFFYRNYQLFGNIMSPPKENRFFSEAIPVEKFSPRYTLSGIVKNAGLNIGLPNTGFNLYLDAKIRQLHTWMDVDIDDPGLRLDHFSVRYSVHEDMVPNTIHFWIIVLAGLILLFSPGGWKIKWFWIWSVLGFILFCTLLKFQLWSTRTQMPFFAMGAVMVAYVFSELLKWKTVILIAPLLLVSSVFVYGNPNKALVPISLVTRKALAHIPVAICESDSAQGQKFRKYLSKYYTFPGENGCHTLIKWPDYSERKKLFSILEDIGYYDDDRSSTVLAMSREKAYFLSHTDNYLNFKPLLGHIEENKNVGLFFVHEWGFYHYWAAMDMQMEHPGKMEYIRYKKEFMVLKNAQKDFCYDYILADDLDLARKTIPKEDIDKIYRTRIFTLIKLKNQRCTKTLF
jgi:hypothetical protein